MRTSWWRRLAAGRQGRHARVLEHLSPVESCRASALTAAHTGRAHDQPSRMIGRGARSAGEHLLIGRSRRWTGELGTFPLLLRGGSAAPRRLVLLGGVGNCCYSLRCKWEFPWTVPVPLDSVCSPGQCLVRAERLLRVLPGATVGCYRSASGRGGWCAGAACCAMGSSVCVE